MAAVADDVPEILGIRSFSEFQLAGIRISPLFTDTPSGETVSDIIITTKDEDTHKELHRWLGDPKRPKWPYSYKSAGPTSGYNTVSGDPNIKLTFDAVTPDIARDLFLDLIRHAAEGNWAMDIECRIHGHPGTTYVIVFNSNSKNESLEAYDPEPAGAERDTKTWHPCSASIRKTPGIKIAYPPFTHTISWMTNPSLELPKIVFADLDVLKSLANRMSRIDRYQGELVIYRQTVWEHTCNVIFFATLISRALNMRGITNDTAKITLMALLHDVDEVFTGDVSQEAKNDYGELSKRLKADLRGITDIKLREIFAKLENPQLYYESVNLMREESQTRTIEAMIVKLADNYDTILYVQNEKSLGNQDPRVLEIGERSAKRFANGLDGITQHAKREHSAAGVPWQDHDSIKGHLAVVLPRDLPKAPSIAHSRGRSTGA